MTTWKYALGALGAALLVAGCGGGGGGEASSTSIGITSMVVYGDSLSDIGTYKVGGVAASGGGKWTVNSPTAQNWTELISAQYKLPTPCAAQTGLFSIIPGFPPVPRQDFTTCRNYAQGSSRVSSPASPNSVAIQQAVLAATGSQDAAIQAAGIGLIALPVVNQMTNHLTAVGGSYSGKELVTVFAGGNDIFLNLNGVSAAAKFAAGDPATPVSAAVGAAQFAGWSPAVQSAIAAGGPAAVNAASQAAVAGMAQAATELVAAINTQVLAKGAKYVVVLNVPDVSTTPFAAALDASTKGLLVNMATAFNSTLSNGLAGKPGILLVDAYTQGRDQIANPGQYALSNVTTPACSKTSPANPGGSSLTCTASSLIPGDTSKYLFADDVHLTPYGYALLAQFVTKNLATAGWL